MKNPGVDRNSGMSPTVACEDTNLQNRGDVPKMISARRRRYFGDKDNEPPDAEEKPKTTKQISLYLLHMCSFLLDYSVLLLCSCSVCLLLCSSFEHSHVMNRTENICKHKNT